MAVSLEDADRELEGLGFSLASAAELRARATWRFEGLEEADRELETLASGIALPERTPAPITPRSSRAKATPPPVPQSGPAAADPQVIDFDEDDIDAEIGDFFGDISIPPPDGNEAVAMGQDTVSDSEVDALLDGFQLDEEEGSGEEGDASEDGSGGSQGYFGKIFG